ncbi:hypothetical protein [Thalassotalea agarivorans]|uniref:Uncharacterized protein n=1 Tax=Thalassotalea agarivorans TaxID=349064 RepID=A0A1I0ENU0_THASX|nr:hypothetical protein [Thalassotalea agarivorans]SET46958.1 hypothetical protein SAMN05660429_01874 [Thalassotalea agarivorans]
MNLQKQPTATRFNAPFIEHMETRSKEELSMQYQRIYQRYGHRKKWILVIGEQCADVLSRHKGMSNENKNILCIHSNKVKVDIENIKAALCKGNCSAIVLDQGLVEQSQATELSACAAIGNTRCIVVDNTNTLH